MRRRIGFLFSLLAGVLCAAAARADVVHVVYQTSAGGAAATITETTLETGCDYTTVSAPALDGYIFTHWSSSEGDPLVVRDAWGRALDAARFTLYQDVTLTAHYVAATLDGDGDGIPDGYELYWYGNLDQTGDSDTDGDGSTFAEELANGTNPLFPDAAVSGGIGRSLSEMFLYNPHNYAPVIMRSEPEGQLFVSTTNYCSAGDLQRSAALAVADGFAVWTVDGVEQRDAFGRALDQVVVSPDTSRIIEVVAHYVEDDSERQSLYWYGNTTTAMDSDTDGDGFTFAEEIANGTNPLFPDAAAPGGAGRSLSETFLYNPHNYAPFVVRSEPEGVLVATATNYVVAGNVQRTVALAVADGFACWTIDGVEQRDAFGRALDQAVVSPDTSRILEVVAHYVEDESARQSLYWYGNTTVAMDSDTDGDGYTFAEEIANGTNPLFPDAAAPGGIGWADMTVECSVEIVADAGTLSAATRAQVKSLLADELAAHAGVVSVTVKGDAALVAAAADLGIAPQLDVLGTGATATYRVPTLEIVAFEPQTGRVRIRVTPGEGNAIRAPLATGCVHVYGTSDLGEKMRYISGTAFDLAPYLGDATRGEADLTVALGSHTFIKVKVETTIKQEGEQE